MSKGMQGLALLVQQHLRRAPHCGDLSVLRSRARSLVKVLWHDRVGMSLYTPSGLRRGTLHLALGPRRRGVADESATGLPA
jgi:transposase